MLSKKKKSKVLRVIYLCEPLLYEYQHDIPVHNGKLLENDSEIVETNSTTLACVQAAPSLENGGAKDHSG